MIKSNKAITLIALIITIIVLLILAAVTINMVLGDNGLFNKAKTSVAKYENAQEKENTALAGYETQIDNARGTVTISQEEYQNMKKEIQTLRNRDNYSEDEQIIGYWIDGKPIYRKVYAGTTPADSTGTYISMNGFISNIDKLIKLEGFTYWNNGWQNRLNDFHSTDDNYDRITYNSTSNQLFIKIYKNSGNYSVPMYITFEYTKTTDPVPTT